MEQSDSPTLGQVLELLRDLGFVPTPAIEGVIAYKDRNSDASFLFRERDLNSPARSSELMNLRTQLTYRGFLTHKDLDRFEVGLKPMALQK